MSRKIVSFCAYIADWVKDTRLPKLRYHLEDKRSTFKARAVGPDLLLTHAHPTKPEAPTHDKERRSTPSHHPSYTDLN